MSKILHGLHKTYILLIELIGNLDKLVRNKTIDNYFLDSLAKLVRNLSFMDC